MASSRMAPTPGRPWTGLPSVVQLGASETYLAFDNDLVTTGEPLSDRYRANIGWKAVGGLPPNVLSARSVHEALEPQNFAPQAGGQGIGQSDISGILVRGAT